ncbi:hypothetical protein ULF88_10310 [Halopseudomonas pachastrellae]|nr:hypothetical protein [Halopseudomonas pachastrellae]
MKATIYALTDNPGEVELAESWLEANRKVLSFISEQTHMVVVSWGGILKARRNRFYSSKSYFSEQRMDIELKTLNKRRLSERLSAPRRYKSSAAAGVTQFPNLLDVGPVRWSRKTAYSVIGTEPFVTFPLSAASDIAAVSSSSICRCEWGSIRCNPDIDSLARR